MAKLTYINDQQIIADSTQMLLEAHLHWSNSTEHLPSEDKSHVLGQIYSALIEYVRSDGDWDKVDDYSKDQIFAYNDNKAKELIREAGWAADKKWYAAMTLLGIEQQ